MQTTILKFDEIQNGNYFNTLKYAADTMLELENTENLVCGMLQEYMSVGNSWREALREASTLRRTHLQDIFADGEIVKLARKIDEKDHQKFVASVMVQNLLSSTWNVQQRREFVKALDAESITSGVLKNDMKIEEKTFRTGTRLTRVLSHMGEVLNDHNFKNRLVGNFKAQQTEEKVVYFAYSPWAILNAGILGNSCLSPEGENEHGLGAALGYKNMFVAYNEDFSWRAWVFLDPENKIYSIGRGYPREDYDAQHLVMDFMREKGYLINLRPSFRIHEYMDFSGLFSTALKKEQVEDIAAELARLGLVNYQAKEETPADRTVIDQVWSHYLNRSIQNYGSHDSIVEISQCQYCDRTSMWGFETGEIDRCGDCYEPQCCNICGGEIEYDEERWDEQNGEYVCPDCYHDEIASLSKTVKLENTAAKIYEIASDILREQQGVEVCLTEYYQTLDDRDRGYLMDALAEWVRFGQSHYILGDILNFHNKNYDYSDLARSLKARDFYNKLGEAALRYYENQFLEGDVQV